jgi:hypothetical protein
MRLQQLTWLRLIELVLVIPVLLLGPGMVIAQEAVSVQLDPVGGSGVSGIATLTAAGEGTQVTLEVEGLTPGTSARATMQANTCAEPSASFAALPELTADASGKATATGSVLFRGIENVALATMADGAHIIAIQTGDMVACGIIPALTSASVSPALPATGGATPWLRSMAAGLIGLCLLSAGLFLRRRSRRPPSLVQGGNIFVRILH